jgi:predicted DNA repair protein MutK
MAGSSLFALIDDIATLLDDIAVMSKVAAKKTAGVLGDDLALNAQQVTGIKADRELPVVFAVAMGSIKNKIILVPAALAISAMIPWVIIPLLMIGGAYLCYEGFEKLAHKFLHSKREDVAHHAEQIEALSNPDVDMVTFEKNKIRGAIRTDFILSAEIIVIALGTVAEATFMKQVFVLSTVALVMTIGVYGLVAGIVKLDDGGLYLLQKNAKNIWHGFLRKIGAFLLRAAPMLMKTLSVVGTAAMFMVGGGILTHGIPVVHHGIQHLAETAGMMTGIGVMLQAITPVTLDALFGIAAGACVLLGISLASRILQLFKQV